jgi:hypothetical protein
LIDTGEVTSRQRAELEEDTGRGAAAGQLRSQTSAPAATASHFILAGAAEGRSLNVGFNDSIGADARFVGVGG